MKRKIELNILVFIVFEALFLLYSFKAKIIDLILGTCLGILFILIFSKTKKNNIIKFFWLLISIVLVIYSLYQISSFITYNLLKNYSIFVIIITFSLISMLLAKKDYHSFIRSLELSFYAFLLIKIISLIFTIPNIRLSNINYSLLDELNPSNNLFLISFFLFYLHELIFYLTDYSISLKYYFINLLNAIIMKIVALLVVGKTLFYLYDYPYMNVLKQIKYLDFIERMEGILSFEYLFAFFFLTSFLLLIIKDFLFHKKRSEKNSLTNNYSLNK